jgi:drug/metabolite transporter (DMT)-like permease
MNAIQLVTLAAIWGASFLFMRMGAPDFGVIPLIALRIGIAAFLLLPVPNSKRAPGRSLSSACSTPHCRSAC